MKHSGYIKAHPELKLALHTPRQVDAWLSAKGRLANIPEWQFRQIADALRLTFSVSLLQA